MSKQHKFTNIRGFIFVLTYKNMEIWKDIIWYEWLYQVSNLWNVKSLSKKVWIKRNNSFWNRKEKLLKPCFNNWYFMVVLSFNSIKTHYSVHRLIWKHFISNNYNKKEINHKNWIKTDNRLENLEWCTRSENMKHAIKTWLQKVKKWKYHHLYWKPSNRLKIKEI
jgi:hypothetical protein